MKTGWRRYIINLFYFRVKSQILRLFVISIKVVEVIFKKVFYLSSGLKVPNKTNMQLTIFLIFLFKHFPAGKMTSAFVVAAIYLFIVIQKKNFSKEILMPESLSQRLSVGDGFSLERLEGTQINLEEKS